MFGLMNTERSVETVAAFIVVFLVTLSIGRLLKRRAGVPFGIFFQLFALALAAYASAWVYGMDFRWRNHVGAAVSLLSTAVVIGLMDRYLWDLYFEKRRQIAIPKFLREIVALVIFLIALLLVLSVGYHAERELRGLLATSGAAAIVLAFATQNLLGGVIAGMAVQINKPYKVGDWLHVGDHFAEVMEINWRSTRLRTNDDINLDIPNNEIVRTTIINLHYPTEVHAVRIRLGIDYNVPPNRVKDALTRAAQSAKNVLADPPVKVYLVDFAESAVTYEVKYYMGNHVRFSETNDSVRTNIWYELKRQRISIPFPIRTLQIPRRAPKVGEHEEARQILRDDRIFGCLSDEHLENLVKEARLNHFGRGENVIQEGDDGDSMFILLRGDASVSVAKNGTSIEVATLSEGDCFGEMSLLTGERRTATVRANADCEVMEIFKSSMAAVLRDAPECVTQLSELLANRKMETEGLLKNLEQDSGESSKEREYRATFLSRLRSVFEL